VLDWDIRASPFPYLCSETTYDTTAEVQTQQTFAFDDSEKQFITTIVNGEDPTHDWGGSNDVDLANWLKRPILAGTYIWEVGEPFPVIYFNPWSAFLDSPSVAQKLSNFYLLRCKIKMKVIVNGSQMHYGRGFISYRPLLNEPGERFQYDPPGFNPFGSVGHDAANFIPVTNGEEVSIMTQSQWPKIFIDPGQSMGGEMTFPFFFGGNWFRIPNRDWVANPSALFSGTNTITSDPYLQIVNGTSPPVHLGPYGSRATHMGIIHSSNLCPLKHANGATDPVTIQVFLWAEDVELSVPTACPHPLVTPLATFESHMGRTEYVPNYLGDLATPGPDVATRLDFGNATLNTDPSTVGLGESDDELAISHIATRECWLDRFTWPVDAPAETAIWQCRVTPQYFKRQIPTGGSIFLASVPCLQPTPSAYAALPFGYWRGSMKYRLQIVASNLHRGRLRIVYDPCVDVLARDNVNDYPEDLMNLQYSRTIDIAGDMGRDFTFEVGYMQEKPYLSLHQLEADNGITDSYDYVNYGAMVPNPSGSIRVAPTNATNGTITIYVLNRLAVPANQTGLNNDALVNVFTAAGDDMSFQMPTSRNLQQMSFVSPTGFPNNFRNSRIPTAIGNAALRRREAAALVRPPTITRSSQNPDTFGASVADQGEFTAHMDGGGDSAAMGATEGENVPEDPPLMATIGDTNQEAAPLAAVTFGENFSSWSTLMERWALYNKEIYCEDQNPDLLSRESLSYTHLNINLDFPPFPGPSPMNSLWNSFTDNSGVPLVNIATPYIAGTGDLDYPGDLAGNAGYNMPPAAKFFLNAPNYEPEASTDMADLLKVNPGELTILHFVTRMFIGRKGAIRNKYVLDGNTSLDFSNGTQLMTVKRLSDSGVLNGNCYLSNTESAQTINTINDVKFVYPCSGNMWNQASCRIANGESGISYGNANEYLQRCQSVNGDTQTGASPCAAPNWYNPRAWPNTSPYLYLNVLNNAQTRGEMMLSNYYDGVHVTTTKQQPVAEVEIPFYVNTRFLQNDLVLTNTKASPAHCVMYESSQKDTTISGPGIHESKITYVERYVKPGSDFSLFYLANVPLIHLCANHLYSTTVNDSPNQHTASYSYLRYRCGARQSNSAFRTSASMPAGSSVFNTTGNDPYFFELHLDDQGAPLESVLGGW